MAYIKKRNARKVLEDDKPSPSIQNWQGDGGLRFNLQIGDYKVSLSHLERDEIILTWEQQLKDFES